MRALRVVEPRLNPFSALRGGPNGVLGVVSLVFGSGRAVGGITWLRVERVKRVTRFESRAVVDGRLRCLSIHHSGSGRGYDSDTGTAGLARGPGTVVPTG
jgi:hypothetical protein